MITPIQKSVTVPLDPHEAFALFTQEIATWWPGDRHSLSARDGKTPKDIRFGTHKGDAIREILEDGSEEIWGRILAYDPGRYLAFTWFPGGSEDNASIVTVTFEETEDGTRCDLNCGGFTILGAVTDAVSTSYLKGWQLVLGCYASAATCPVTVPA